MSNGDSFEPFVRTNSTDLLRTALLLTGNRDAAEDLLQDTLAHLYPQWQRVDNADSSLPYVRRALTNRFLSARRSRRGRDVAMWELPDGWDGQDLSETVANRSAIWDLLGTLSERQRAAVVLRFFHDLPDDQIALVLGCRNATVRTLVSRAMASMRQRYPSRPTVTTGTETAR